MNVRLVAGAILATTVTALTGMNASSQGGEVVLGTSLPLTGPLGAFGAFLKVGYEQAIKEVNDAGGLRLAGQKRPVKLEVLDNASDPNQAGAQARTLILKNGAVGLLGAATPPLNIPISSVAETQKVPAVVTITPVNAWLGGNKGGWKYAWDFFFDENQQTDLALQGANLIKTNKKVALFIDNEDDGVVMGGIWDSKVKKFGYEVAARADFPVGTEDYSNFINKAKAAGAEILIGIMIPPDGIALVKQMKAANWRPKLTFIAKAVTLQSWSDALGPIGEGAVVEGWWTPNPSFPSVKALSEAASKLGKGQEASGATAAYTAAKIMLEAMSRAGSTDAGKVNAEIAKTNKTFPFGKIKFGENHAAITPSVLVQWQNGAQRVVMNANGKGTGKINPFGGN